MNVVEESYQYVVSAPGKVILFGEHSVVYKKAAVCTSINRRLSVIVKSANDFKITISFPQINTNLSCSLEQFEKVIKKKCPLEIKDLDFLMERPELIDYHKYIDSLKNDLAFLGINKGIIQEKAESAMLAFIFVMRGMFHMVTSPLLPFSLEVQSDIEVGAGTGSSAAFAVALSGAVLHLRKKYDCSNEICSSSNVDDSVFVESFPLKSGFTVTEAKIINKWAFCIEKIMHGRPSGIDNTTCTFGSVVVTSQHKIKGHLVFTFLENVPKISILLISTCVSRNTASLVAKVGQLRDDHCAVVDGILNVMDTIAQEAFKTLEKLGSNSALSSLELYKTLNGLMELNHGLLRTLGVSHETLEQIVSVTNRHGLSTKLTGAGGGGYAITLLPPNFPKDEVLALKSELEPTFKVSEISIADDGVRLENIL